MSVTSSVSIPALASYSVKYNANGGSGEPSEQTKWYGEELTLRDTTPKKTGHGFKGWATSKGGSVAYSPGAKYTANSAVTLYAVWEVAYTNPRIELFEVWRSNEAGSETNAKKCTTYRISSRQMTFFVFTAKHRKCR